MQKAAAHTQVHSYYNELAATYDQDRFGNSYGRYIHAQEWRSLQKLIPPQSSAKVLDLGCGTGRFLQLATHGTDISENMLQQAATKHPGKILEPCSSTVTPFSSGYFDTVFSMHVLMHQPKHDMPHIFQEVHRLLKPGGRFIFDIPSAKRRNLIGYKAQGWHAAASLSIPQIKSISAGAWQLKQYSGIAFFPLHRIPSALRTFFLPADHLLCHSPLKEYASYLLVVLQKQ